MIDFIIENFACDYDTGEVYSKQECRKIIPYVSASGVRRNEEPSKYYKFSFKGKKFLLHRVLYISKHRLITDVVDHINGNTLDNRIYNLRGVSHRENSLNRKLSSLNSSGTTGVHLAKNGKYIASITISGKKIWLGAFAEIEDAKTARMNAEIENGFHENHGKR